LLSYPSDYRALYTEQVRPILIFCKLDKYFERSELHSISDEVSSLQRRLSILHDSAQTLASQPNNKEPFQEVARKIEDRSEK